MSDIVVLLILTAFVLGYASLLLSIRLGSLGVSRGQMIGIIIEVWLTFGVIIGLFALLQQFLGPVPRTGFPGELFAQIDRLNRLPIGQRLLTYGGFIAAIALFAHLLWSFRAVQRDAPLAGQPPAEDQSYGNLP